MTHNPILDELHLARQQLLVECNGDTTEYLRQAEKRLRESGRPIAKVKQRSIRCIEPAKSGDLPFGNESMSRGDLS